MRNQYGGKELSRVGRFASICRSRILAPLAFVAHFCVFYYPSPCHLISVHAPRITIDRLLLGHCSQSLVVHVSMHKIFRSARVAHLPTAHRDFRKSSIPSWTPDSAKDGLYPTSRVSGQGVGQQGRSWTALSANARLSSLLAISNRVKHLRKVHHFSTSLFLHAPFPFINPGLAPICRSSLHVFVPFCRPSFLP